MSNTAVNLALAAAGMESTHLQERKDVDVLLIGAGVMSATFRHLAAGFGARLVD